MFRRPTTGLSEGISQALAASKAVAIYITPETESERSDVCKVWEDEWLEDEQINQWLEETCIPLKVLSPSVELQQLQAFVPISRFPALVVIRDGSLAGAITERSNFTEFTIQLRIALGIAHGQAPQPRDSTPTTVEPNEPASPPQAGSSPAPLPTRTLEHAPQDPALQPSRTVEPAQPSPPPPQPSEPELVPPPRVEQPVSPPSPPEPVPVPSPAEVPSSPTQPHQPHPITPVPSQPSSPSTATSSARQTWVEQQRTRNLQAKQERERIRAQIEADKRARKAREEETRRQRAGLHAPEQASSTPSKSKSTAPASVVHLQTRLLSGRTIRKDFAPTATPAADLRPWIDAALSADEGTVPAYRLKQICTPPQPAREFAVTEETDTLVELGLAPSATLVVTFVPRSADAYAGAGGGIVSSVLGLPGAVIGGVYGLAAGAVNATAGMVGSALGIGNQGQQNQHGGETQDDGGHRLGQGSGRVRTMGEMRADGERDPQQLYNGNQLNFEADDGEDK